MLDKYIESLVCNEYIYTNINAWKNERNIIIQVGQTFLLLLTDIVCRQSTGTLYPSTDEQCRPDILNYRPIELRSSAISDHVYRRYWLGRSYCK